MMLPLWCDSGSSIVSASTWRAREPTKKGFSRAPRAGRDGRLCALSLVGYNLLSRVGVHHRHQTGWFEISQHNTGKMLFLRIFFTKKKDGVANRVAKPSQM